MLVLAIDTSTPTVTAGVVRVKRPHEILAQVQSEPAQARRGASARREVAVVGGSPHTCLAEHTVTDRFGHAEHLMPLVTAALADAGCTIGDLEAVVVGTGPGPFTGLRVGLVTAAALGDALDIPVYGVPSHDAEALRVAADADSDGDFLVVTDARRREVYLSAYSESAVRQHGPVVIAPATVRQWLAARSLAPRWIGGAGADLLADVLGLPVRRGSGPLSGFLVDRAARALLTGAVPGPLSPLYLRRPDATEPSGPKRVLPLDDPVGPGR